MSFGCCEKANAGSDITLFKQLTIKRNNKNSYYGCSERRVEASIFKTVHQLYEGDKRGKSGNVQVQVKIGMRLRKSKKRFLCSMPPEFDVKELKAYFSAIALMEASNVSSSNPEKVHLVMQC
nr:hypothetical protein [Tanacetum cinerariifolium]